MFLLRRKYRPLLGLDITTSSVKLIELAMAGGQYRVESYAAEPTPQNAMNEKAIVDAEAVGEAIRRAAKRAGAKSREVAIAISGDAAIEIGRNDSFAEGDQPTIGRCLGLEQRDGRIESDEIVESGRTQRSLFQEIEVEQI